MRGPGSLHPGQIEHPPSQLSRSPVSSARRLRPGCALFRRRYHLRAQRPERRSDPGQGGLPTEAQRREDIEITRRLREAGDIIGVCVLDQIIVGEGRYVSFDDDGYW